MNEGKSEIEQVYVNLVDTQKKHIDSMQGNIHDLEEQINVQKEHIKILERSVVGRDQLIKIQEETLMEIFEFCALNKDPEETLHAIRKRLNLFNERTTKGKVQHGSSSE